NDSSTFCSKNSLTICPYVISLVISILCSFASALASSSVILSQKSTPVYSFTASTICSLFHEGSRFTSCSPYLIKVVPRTSFAIWAIRFSRSEEHTSELQSRFDLVCRLLLEKKNLHISTLT